MNLLSLLIIFTTLLTPTWALHSRAPASRIKPDVLNQLTEKLLSEAEAPLFKPKASKTWVGNFDRTSALDDPAHRIADEFKIPKLLKKRTQFWFDIYTKYGSNHHVIHHARYPWIIFKVVDTSAIENNKNLHKWTKYHKAKKLVSNEKTKIRKALKRLANTRHYKNLKGTERSLYNSMASLRGARNSVFKHAAGEVRSQLGQKDFLLSGLQQSSRYLPYMEQEFREVGLPTELTRIPFVESSFNVHAQSKVGASGIWQIMPSVGKAYFTVTPWIDERNSPLKASLVAIDLLQRNYKTLKTWPLAVTAYNHGAYGVKKALRKSRSKNLVQLISRYHKGSFKFASSNFYTSFLAVLHAEKYHHEIFHDLDIEKEEPLRYSVYQLKKSMRAHDLVKLTRLNNKTFLSYNLDLKASLKKNSWIPKGFRLLVPLDNRLEIDAKSSGKLRPIREAHLEKQFQPLKI